MSKLALLGASNIGFLIGGAFALANAYEKTRPFYAVSTATSSRVYFAGVEIFSSYPSYPDFVTDFQKGANIWHFNSVISLFEVVLFPYLGEKIGSWFAGRAIVAHPHTGPYLKALLELVGSISIPSLSRPMILGTYLGIGLGIGLSFAINRPFHCSREENGSTWFHVGEKRVPFEYTRSNLAFLLKIRKFTEERLAGDPLKMAILVIFSGVLGLGLGKAWEKSTLIIASLSSSILNFAFRLPL